jgi:membrane peptidoglycan carboxypeptidase
VSSRADDFDVRYGGAGSDRPGANGGHGGYGGTVSYDLGYDAEGWDTQGFRSPVAGRAEASLGAGSQTRTTGPGTETARTAGFGAGAGTAVRPGRGRTGSHARPERGSGPDEIGELPAGPPGPPVPGRRRRPDRTPRRAPKVKVKGSWWRRWTLRKALGVTLGVVGGFVVLAAVAVVVTYEKTPVPTAALAAASDQQSVVYSGNGTLIGRFGTTNRQMLRYDQFGPKVINAVLAAEDRNFFSEGGVSPTGIMRAAYSDVTGGDGSLQGGSTITQEFVRQYYSGIGTQQTMSRKIKEIFVAMKIAKSKSKQWILENYLNTIYFGQGAYGIGAAAMTYYNEPVSNLTWAQAAVIAAIIQQPSTYPLPKYRAQLEARWHYVLNGLVQMGKLSGQQAQSMKFPKPGDFVPQSVGYDVWDPYVLNMVYNELVDVYHFSQQQIYNGGYVIRTTIDDAKMAALYKAVRDNEALMDASSVPFNPTYMHAGAVLEDPATGAIEALYPGPGYPGNKYNGTGKVITAKYCKKIACEVNMAVYNREQVGSSFKPYVLATAVKQGMNVQTSTLNGFNPLWIPPDSQPATYSANSKAQAGYQWFMVGNDSMGENGPYNAQMAMAVSINTAYADLWHKVGGAAVAQMAQAFGVKTDEAGITGPGGMVHEAGIALGQGSLTVGEQATMLATLADNGVYHDAHVISKITQNGMPTPIKITSYPIFSSDPTQNANEASQIQYAMSKDDASYGTAPVAAMSNGQEIIAKTGTTNIEQSAFFEGAIPSQSLAVALFTNQQGKGTQTLKGLGGLGQGGFGGTWPATIWHTYAEDMFLKIGVQQFPMPVFTGAKWNQVPPGLQKPAKKHKKKHDHGNGNGNGNPNPFGPPGQGNNPNPYPTYSCDPTVVTCSGNGGGNVPTNNATAPPGVGAVIVGVPPALLWAGRRMRKKKHVRG